MQSYGNTRKEHGFTFLTKDKDFASLSIAWGAPPKVVLLQTGNCSSATIDRIVRSNAIRLSDFENDTRPGPAHFEVVIAPHCAEGFRFWRARRNSPPGLL